MNAKVTPISSAPSAKAQTAKKKKAGTEAPPIPAPVFCERGQRIRDRVIDMEIEDEVLFLDPPHIYDPAIIGLTEGNFEPPRLIYDAERCIEQLVLNDMGDYETAREFFEFNTLGAFVKNGPLFVESLVPMRRLKDEKAPSKKALNGPDED
jgi:hypothetical protein